MTAETTALPAATALAPGQVLMAIRAFSLTANNISYAITGDALQYWQFFPAAEGRGIIPVWGFADVIASHCDGIGEGERFYGYYPMATHMVATPVQVNPRSFVDGAEHRQSLPAIYNQYLRCSTDPLYSADTEGLQMLLRPLFTTSFLLDDFFADNEFFGAETLLLTSASSKTAVGMAFCLHANRGSRDQRYEIVGLTSAGNQDFVASLGCYDRVLTYDEIETLGTATRTASVDFAGNSSVLARIHARLGSQLRYSCRVGASHWDQGGLSEQHLPDGPQPILFFAPTQAEKRLQDWGPQRFMTQLAGQWAAFLRFTDDWLDVILRSGHQDLIATYGELLTGNVSPRTGYIISPGD
jgi:hypothetical protein